MKIWQLRVREHFDAAHQLRDYVGPCARLHGHRWEVEVVFEVRELPLSGIAIDFGDIKQYLKEVLPDHRFLNEWMRENPTAENIAQRLLRIIRLRFAEVFPKVSVQSATVWESPECSVTYQESPANLEWNGADAWVKRPDESEGEGCNG